MEQLKFGLTNSEMAQVEFLKKDMLKLFDTKYSSIKQRVNFYTQTQTIVRFAIAREFEKPKVLQMWEKWIQWYQKYRPDNIKSEQQIITKIHTSGKYRYAGYDKDGCPILIIRMRYHIKGLATADQNLRYLLFMLQAGIKLAQQKNKTQLSIIFDRRNMAQSDQVSSQSMKKFMPILNDCYPQRLKAFYVLGANWFYRAMWKIVSVFISKKTQDKINLLKQESQLKNFITPQNLTTEYGGILNYNDTTRVVPLKYDPAQQKENKEEIEKIQKEWKNN